MADQTCAACDYVLDDKRISVTIGGKTVEVCCEECAQTLREAQASAAGRGRRKGSDPDGDVAVARRRRDTVRPDQLCRAGQRTGRALRPRRAAERLPLASSARRAADTRRCIAVDLLGARGHRDRADPGRVGDRERHMLLQFLDALGIDQVDLVGNDSGGGIARSSPRSIRPCTQPHAHELRHARQLAA